MAMILREILSPTGTTFTSDGTYTFPAGVTKVRAFLWGGGGKTGTFAGGVGGAGAYLAVDITKGARTTLTISLNKGIGACGPVNGGGFGGGYSSVSTVADGIIALAGAGGGTGNNYFGGGGGFLNGSQGGNASQVGTVSTSNNFSHGGGGSQNAGGAAGISPLGAGFINGNAGTSLQGGNANTGSGYGGGGGGGYYGGGGGGGDANQSPYTGMGAGGGGSSFISSAGTLIEGQAGPNGATGGVNPGGTSSPYYIASLGASNQNGLVVIVPFLTVQTTPPQFRMNNLVAVNQRSNYYTTSSVQTFTVPQGVFGIRFFLWGAGGVGQNSGENVNSAGGGAFVEGNLQTLPGAVFSIVVGARGRYFITPTIANGGASGGGTGADGGGFSGIFSSTPGANTVIAIAGGGGGAGFNGNGYGGGGGFPSGGTAQGGSAGGSQSAGGGGSFPGSQFLGGVAGFGGDCCGGGGGGGWYGGGGGNNSQGGGGGSSTYTSVVFNPVLESGTNGSPTGVTPTPPGGRSSPYWISPFGSAGQTGLVVIGFSPSVASPTSFRYNVPTETVLQTFTATGSVQSYTIPAGTNRIRIYAWASGGGNGNGSGGGGGFVSGSVPVNAGQVLYIVVGTQSDGYPSIARGAGGGRMTKYFGAGGGGFSGVFLSSSPAQGNCICIAGAGGSGNITSAGGPALTGGPGGYPSGFAGGSDVASGRTGGGGATQTSGGTGGGADGTVFFGGDGTSTASDAGSTGGWGSGGGGWYGGGGSARNSTNAGGGGGSGFIGGLFPPIQTGNGSYPPTSNGTGSAGGETSPYWQSPYGRSGQNGYVVITRFQ